MSERAADEEWGAVVVGGGLAGLVAARELLRAGVRTLVVEGVTRSAARCAGTSSAG